MPYENLPETTDKIILADKLGFVAGGLTKVVSDQSLSEEQIKSMNFLGKVFARMQDHKSYPELAVFVTDIKPEFLNALPPNENDYEKISRILQEPYRDWRLTEKELIRFAEGLKLISTNINATLQARYRMGQI